MGMCTSYTDAMSQIEDYFGTDLISIKYLELYAECSLIPMPMSAVTSFAESDWPVDNACIPCTEKGVTRAEMVCYGDEDASQKPPIMDNALAKPLDLVMEEMKGTVANNPNRNTQLDVNFSMKPANAMETFGKGR
jgi:hypothetical protein